MTRQRLLIALGILVFLLLAAGHVGYHYLPRPRPASPGADTPAAQLLTSDTYPLGLWMPHPHQNLGFLKRSAGLDSDSLRALARLAGLPTPGLPSFGAMLVPPASELTIVSDEAGERWVISAQVYPAFATFARLSGRLADNPWLKGGEIYSEGRRAEVVWHGNLWTVASPSFPELSASESSAPSAAADEADTAPALAVVRMRQGVHPLPAGRYRLVQQDTAFEIVSAVDNDARAADGGFENLGLSELGVFLITYSGRVAALGEPAQSLAFFGTGSDRPELPRVASICEPDGERWSLPGESILELGGRKPRQAEVAGWSLAALDATSLEGARILAPRLEAFRVPAPGRPVWGLWLDLGAGLREIARLAERLAELPLAPRRQLERWRDAETVLLPLARRFSRVTVTVTDEPRVFRLRLAPAPGERAE